MKKVLILFGRSAWQKSRPFENPQYQYSYEYFYNLCQKSGIQMYRASYQWYDHEKHIFKYAWIFTGKNGKWKKTKNIKPDLIYDKTKARLEVYYQKELIRKHYPFINDLNFTQLVDDKFLTSLIFAPWSKKSWLVDCTEDIKKILPKIKTAKVVIKPLMESGGKDIIICNKKEAAKLTIHNTRIVQEFIDSSAGIPGFCSGYHDLRLVFINDRIIYAYVRQPQAGSLLANLAQGGTLDIVPKNKLPKSLNSIIEHANNVFATFNPRIYSLDFMFDKHGRPWVVELNSMPGLYFTPKEKLSMMEMYRELLKVFQKELGLK